MQNTPQIKTKNSRNSTTDTAPTRTPAVVPTAKSAKPPTPGHDEIAKRAYEIFLARGKTSGHEVEDWTQAERELSARSHSYN